MKPFNPATQNANVLAEPEKVEVEKGEKVQRRESSSGIHFIELYNACQRKFYFTYQVGLKTVYVDKALIFGGEFHEAKATYYDTEGQLEKAIDVGETGIVERKEEFYSPEDFDFSLSRLRPLLTAWEQTFGAYDMENYEVLGTEQEFKIPVPFTPGYVLTQRHDALLRHRRTSKVITMETKTSSSSVNFTLESVPDSSQAIGYIWGGQEVFGRDYEGLVVDVAYWSSRSTNPKTIQCVRSEPITKGRWDTKKLQVDAASLFNEIEAKQKSLASGVPAEFLYRRNTFYCHSFFRPCPFRPICNMPTGEIMKHLPEHITVEDGDKRLDGTTYDTIHFGEG